MTDSIFKMGNGALISTLILGSSSINVYMLIGQSTNYALLWATMLSLFIVLILHEMVGRITIASNSIIQDVMLKSTIKMPSRIVKSMILGPLILGVLTFQVGSMISINNYLVEFLAVFGYFIDYGIIVILVTLLAYISLRNTTLNRISVWAGRALVVSAIIMVLLSLSVLPSFFGILKGIFIPTIPKDKSLVLISAISTGIVPFSLFIYSNSIVNNKSTLKHSRLHIYTTLIVSALIILSIIILVNGYPNQSSLSTSLISIPHPKLDVLGQIIIAMVSIVILFLSILISSISLGTIIPNHYYTIAGSSISTYKILTLSTLILGMFLSLGMYKPMNILDIISFVNGLFLPLIAIFLLFIANKRSVMKTYKNKWYHNLCAIVVIILCTVVGLKNIFSALNFI